MSKLKQMAEKYLNLLKDMEKDIKLNSVEVKLKDWKVDDTLTLVTEADEPKVGDEIYVMEGEEKKSAPDGEYKVDSIKIVISEGKISDIAEIKEEAEVETEMEEDTTAVTTETEESNIEERLSKLEEMISRMVTMQEEQIKLSKVTVIETEESEAINIPVVLKQSSQDLFETIKNKTKTNFNKLK